MMGDWDDEEADDFVAKKIESCWDDDIADIPDSWDAEEPTEPTAKAAAAPEKLPLAERIKIREDNRRKEKEEKLKRMEESQIDQSMTEIQREKLAEEAEIGLLQDTFGDAPIAENSSEIMNIFNAQTKEDFDKLNDLLKEKLTKLESSPHFNVFAERLIRDALVGMDAETLKSLNATVSALVTEKQKLVKSKVKKKGKGKLLVERDNDYNFQEDTGAPDEYDDFI